MLAVKSWISTRWGCAARKPSDGTAVLDSATHSKHRIRRSRTRKKGELAEKKHIWTWHAQYKRQGQGWSSMLGYMNEDMAQGGHTVEVYGDRSMCMQQIRFHLRPAGKAVSPRDFPKKHLFHDPSTYRMVLGVSMFYSEVRKEICWNSWRLNMLLEQNET